MTTKASTFKSGFPLIVLGFDDQQKPRGAKFDEPRSDLVTKAAELLGLNVYEASVDEIADLAKQLPIGRLYSNGKGFVPNIKQSLYSKLLAALAGEPKAAICADEKIPPIAPTSPKSWDEIAAGHVVIAQESHENGWWESIVVERRGDMLTMRFRDFPKLPKFTRHRSTVALIRPLPQA